MKTRKLLRSVFMFVVGLVCALICLFMMLIYFIPFFHEILMPTYFSVFPSTCTITDQPIKIEESIYNPANNEQTGANVWMAAYNEKLYFYPIWCSDVKNRTKYYHQLSVFENRTATRILKIQDGVIGMQNGYIYYLNHPAILGIGQTKVNCYSILDRKATSIYSMSVHNFTDYYFSSTGGLYLPADDSRTMYRAVYENSVDSLLVPKETYTLNTSTYSVEGYPSSEVITVTDVYGEKRRVDTIPQGRISIFQCKEGLLVHNQCQRTLLYLIHEGSGEVVDMFTVPEGHVESAVNLRGNYVFLSFSRIRYDEEKDTHVPYENDTLAGTYRISLKDFSAEKISDAVYTGLYIFDDTGIYVCDENCHMYKLDFDGNVTMVLLE